MADETEVEGQSREGSFHGGGGVPLVLVLPVCDM